MLRLVTINHTQMLAKLVSFFPKAQDEHLEHNEHKTIFWTWIELVRVRLAVVEGNEL